MALTLAAVAAGQSAQAFSGTTTRNIDLPSSGGVFKCNLEAFTSEPNSFTLLYNDGMLLTNGLDLLAQVGYSNNVDTVEYSISNIEAGCRISDVVVNYHFDRALSVREASLISMEMLYTGQDGQRYQVRAALTGQTYTAASASVSVYTPPPEVRAIWAPPGADTVDVANGANISLGYVSLETPYTADIYLRNDGPGALNTGEVHVIGSQNVEVRSFSTAAISGIATNHSGKAAGLSFVPQAAGPFRLTFSVETNDPDENPTTFSVSGIGKDIDGPQLTLVSAPEYLTGPSGDRLLTFDATEAGRLVVTEGGCTIGFGQSLFTAGRSTVQLGAATPGGGGTYKCRFSSVDLNGNQGNSFEVQYRIDAARPYFTAAGRPGDLITGPFEFALTVSEDPREIDTSILVVQNGFVSNVSSTTVFGTVVHFVTITPSSSGLVTVDIPEGARTDAVGNVSLPLEQIRTTADLSGPLVTLRENPFFTNAPFDLRVKFNEPALDFDVSDITLTNATAALVTSSIAIGVPGAINEAIVRITPIADGNVTMRMLAGAVEDEAGNPNVQTSQRVTTYDGTRPNVSISVLTGPSEGPFTAEITSNEFLSGLTPGDLMVTNATATLDKTGASVKYVVTLAPIANGEVRLSLPDGAATDFAGNLNTASNEVTAEADVAPPGITIAPFTGPANGARTALITLTENATDFEPGDLVTVNATATLSGSGRDYTAVLTPLADGAIRLFVPAGSFTDAVGKPNLASNVVVAEADITGPGIVIGALSGPANGDRTARITLTEASTDFTAGDLVLTNATATLSGSGTRYTATLSPLADGEVRLSVPAGAFTDAAGNASTASNVVTATHDSGAPTITIGAFSGPANGVQEARITLSAASTDFTAGDLAVTNATAVLSGSGTSYTAVLTPLADGVVRLSVDAGRFTNGSGSANIASNEVTANVDITAPAVLIGPFATAGGAERIATIYLSEPVTDFDLSDLKLTNATATFSGSGARYSAVLTPLADGVMRLSVAAGRFTDAAGNRNTASNEVTATHDSAAPTVNIGVLTGPANGAQAAAITLSAASTDFTVDDLELTNATAVLTGSGVNYTAVLTPLADGTLGIRVPAGSFTDGDGRPNTASIARLAEVDITAPGVTIDGFSGAPTGAQTAQITLSEASTDFTAADLDLVNATASLSGSGTGYTAVLTPSGDGIVRLSVAPGRFTDAAGNPNTASNAVTATVDVTPPSAAIGGFATQADGTQTATVTLSEPSTDFTVDDLTVGNATARMSGSGTSYTVTLTPLAYGSMQLSVGAGRFSDAAGNGNIASATAVIIVATVPPVASFSLSPDLYRDGDASVQFGVPSRVSFRDTSTSVDAIVSTTWDFGDGSSSTAANPDHDFAATREHVVTLTVCTASACDTATRTISVRLDYTRSVTLSGLSGTITGPVTVSARFQPGIYASYSTPLTASDFTVTGATLADLSGPAPVDSSASQDFSFTVTPNADGPVSVQLPSGAKRTIGNSPFEASNLLSATFDGTAPTASIAPFTGPSGGVQTAVITLSEPSTDLALADLSLTNASAAMVGSGTQYTAVLTPLADGPVTLSIPAGRFSDAAGNTNLASNTVTTEIDTVAPGVSIAAFTGPPNGVQTAVITLTEPGTGFDVTALTLRNATAVLSGSGTSYTAVLTPRADGEVALSIAAGAFADAAGNPNTASNEVTAEVDVTPPSVSIADFTGPAGGPQTAVITLSEPSTDFTAGDLAPGNATAVLSGSGASYTAVLTPQAAGPVTLSVPAGVFTDAAGNANTGSNGITSAPDTTPPTIHIADLTGPADGAQTAIITLSEPSDDFTVDDLDLTNATATMSGSGAHYTAVLTPVAAGPVSLHVAAGRFTDAAGNANAASNTVITGVDSTPPTVSIAAFTGPPNGVQTAVITLSEPSTDFTLADLTLTNATAVLTGSGANYTAVLTPLADGTVVLSVAAGVFTDGAGNGNAASGEVTVEVDITAPTIHLADLVGPEDSAQSSVITLSEPSGDFDLDDLTLTNATATLSGAGAAYVAVLTPVAAGPVSLQVAAGRFTDAAGNANTASNTVTTGVDTTPPGITIAEFTGAANGPRTATITLTEPSVDFELEDLALTNATATLDGSGTDYTAVLTPLADGLMALSVPAGAFTDAAGNASLASNEVTAEADLTAPTIAIAAFTGGPDGVQTALITLSEASTDFTVEDLTLTNATAVLDGAGVSYAAVLTPVADGLVALSVAAGAFTDAAGNANLASNEVSVVVDTLAPRVTLATTATEVVPGRVVDVTVTFSEVVTGFAAAGLTVANGRVTALTGGDADYVAQVTASGAGDLVVTVPAGAASDLAGNANLASEPLSLRNATVEATQKVIARFMSSRANQLLANQPDLIALLAGRPSGGFSLNATGGTGSFSFISPDSWDSNSWARVNGSWSFEDGGRTAYVLGAFGRHAKLSETLLIGGMVELDYTRHDRDGAEVEGFGWLAGPYVVAWSAGHPLFFEGRLLYGRSYNSISPFGSYSDRFDTERWLAQVRVQGEMTFDRTVLRPGVLVSYTSDAQESYVDSLGNRIPAQRIELGQVELGVDFRTPAPFYGGPGEMILTGGFRAIASHSGQRGSIAVSDPPFEGGRGRIDLGLDYRTRRQTRVALAAFYDGIGAAGYESYGVEFGFDWRF